MTGELGLWPLVLLAAAGTYVWRGLGVIFSARIKPASAAFQWINCVAHAMIAGLVARMVVMPSGGLTETPLVDRLAATAFGFAVFFLCRRNVLAGVAGGVAFFILLAYWRQGF